MKVRKIFALSILATSIALAAGCSSDDDDETPPVTDPDPTDPDPTDPDPTDPDPTDPDPTDPDPTDPEPETDMSTNTGTSVLDIARGTDGDGDGVIDLEGDAAANAELTTLVSLVSAYPDLLNLLDDETAMLTVFAPTNTAFDAAVAAGLDTSDADAVKRALQYHVVTQNIDETAALTMLDTDIVTAAEGGTLQISQAADGSLQVTDSAGNMVALGTSISASNGNASVYVIDSVLTAPAAVEPDPVDPTDPTDPTGAAGSSFAVIESDSSLSEFEALVLSSNFKESLEDVANRSQVIFAPRNGNLETGVDTVVAYVHTNRAAATVGPVGPGTYPGTGAQALSFEVAGEGETLTVNGMPAQYIETSSGAALYVYGTAS